MGNRLAGKVAVITGAGSGIGRAAAELFCEEGARVILAERDPATGTGAQDRLREAGYECLFVETDVSDSDQVKRAVDSAVSEYGRLDVLYNNAGGSTMQDGMITEAPFEEFWNKMRVDLFGVWTGCHYAIPHLRESGGGAIINTTSVLALMGTVGRDAYTAAKGGVISLSRSLAVEYAPDRIRVNALAPGVTATERVAPRVADPTTGAWKTAQRSPLGVIEPREIAYMALFLASDEAKKITGQIFAVDSGLTIC